MSFFTQFANVPAKKSVSAKAISRAAYKTPKRVLEQQAVAPVVVYTAEQFAAMQAKANPAE